jgi:hypothetical protein
MACHSLFGGEHTVSDRPQYEHDASKGETRHPPQEGEQYGGRPGERDPHSRLNTPLSELDREAAEEERGGSVRKDDDDSREVEGADARRAAERDD